MLAFFLANKWVQYALGGLLVCGLLWWVVTGYISRERNFAQLQGKIQASEEYTKKLESDKKDLAALIIQTRTDADRTIASIQKQRQSIKTPEQAIKVVNDVLPTATVNKLPDAPSVLSQADAKTLADLALSVQQIKVDNDALRQENKLLRESALKDLEQIKLLTQQRDDALKLAKGGTFWKRTGTALKYVGIGIGIGYVIAHR